MSKVALVSENAIFMCFIMSASLSLILVVDFISRSIFALIVGTLIHIVLIKVAHVLLIRHLLTRDGHLNTHLHHTWLNHVHRLHVIIHRVLHSVHIHLKLLHFIVVNIIVCLTRRFFN